MRSALRCHTLDASLVSVMHTFFRLLFLLLHALVSHAVGRDMCTKSVPMQRIARKKVSVLRRVPASCSNWEKAWSWVTKQDCGTKYRLDMVEVPSPKVVTYRMVKVCCDGDIQCQQAQADDMAAEKEAAAAEEKFLAIVLGSCASVLLIVVLVVTVSLCRRKKRCMTACEERKHVYITTEEEEESSELQTHKEYRHEDDQTTQTKVCESFYAEIHDPGLPRYADIFREDASTDHFQHATAPPIALYESRAGAVLTHDKRAQSPNERDISKDVEDTTHNLLQQDKLTDSQCSDITENAVQYNEQSQTKKCTYPEDALSSVTYDDPAVMPVSSSLSPSSSISPQTRGNRGCEESRQMNGSPVLYTCQNKACPTQYESLGSRGCRDCHEYQRLSMTVVKDLELTSVTDHK